MNIDNQKQFYTTIELAAMLGISRIAVFNQIKKGKIKAQKMGRNYIILPADLPAMLSPELSLQDKKRIEKGVKKILKDYGETIQLLGKE